MSARRIVVATIKDRVQAVGFRAWTQGQAELRGLEGWVRNRRNGSVEAVFAGSSGTVEAMLRVCHQGPYGSRVDSIDVRDAGEVVLAERPSGCTFAVLATV